MKAINRRYLRGAADYWFGACLLQQERTTSLEADTTRTRIDLNFYVVAVQRLRNIAMRVMNDPEGELVREALASFDDRWPRFRALRNAEEYPRDPSGDAPLGIWYFGDRVVDLQPDGGVDYLVLVPATQRDVETLYDALRAFLGYENGPPDRWGNTAEVASP